MKRRDEAGRAERGPFSTGLAGQAARQAGSQAQSSIYAQMRPPLLLFRLHISSARCTVLSKDHLGKRWRGERERARFEDLLYLQSSLPSTPVLSFAFAFLAEFICPRYSRGSSETLKRRLVLKTLPRSVFVCLPPSLPSVPLPPSSGFYFAYSICWLLP